MNNIYNAQISVKDILSLLANKQDVKDITLSVGTLTQDEKNIILKGCLINFNAAN